MSDTFRVLDAPSGTSAPDGAFATEGEGAARAVEAAGRRVAAYLRRVPMPEPRRHELTLRTLESRTPLVRCHRQYLVNMAHLKEIRLEDNGQAELILRAGQTVPVSRRYLKSLKEAIGL